MNENALKMPLIWVAAAALLALQIGAFTWRINREIYVAEKLRYINWFPWVDRMNVAAMVASLVVFALPLFTQSGSVQVCEGALLISVILSIGYPFAVVTHYDLWCEGARDFERGKERSRRVVIVVLVVAVFGVSLFVVIPRDYNSSTFGDPMKSRAAVALVGWYLMMPPPSALHPSLHPVALSQWFLIDSYDSAEECRANLLKALKHPPRFPGASKEEAQVEVLGAQCIASDDPRLAK